MKPQQALATVAMAVAVLFGAAVAAHAQDPAKDYPSKTITLVVPFPPGGGNDAMARIMADRLSAGLGKTVVVENRGAGAGIIGTRSVVKAAPDGYTLMLGHTGSIGINPTLYVNAGFDPRKDFTALGLIAQLSLVLLVHPSVQAKDVAGPDRARESQSRQVQLRLVGAGHRLAHVRRDVPARGGDRHEFDSVQGHGAARHRSRRRSCTGIVRGDHAVVRQHQGRQPARAGGDRTRSARRCCRTCRRSRNRDSPASTCCSITASWRRRARRSRSSTRSTKRCVLRSQNEEVRKRIAADGAEAVSSTPAEYGAIVDRDMTRWSALIKKLNLKVE